MLAGFATDMSADKNPVPNYRNMLEEYEAFKQKVFDLLGVKLDSADFAQEYAQVTGVAMYSADPQGLKDGLQDAVKAIFAALDKAVYDDLIHNFVYYFGCNYYAQQSENGFDLLVSKDGVNFDAITRDGFGDGSNHGLRTICSTENGVYMGTANPFYGTQLWRMYSAEDKPLVKEHTHQWSDTWSSDGENHWHDCLADGCTVTDNSQKDGFGAHTFVDGVCSVCGYQQTGSGSGGDAGGSGQPSQPGQPGQGGDSGNNGNTGDNGNTGNNGNTGDNGNTGNSGNTGNNGNTGNTGNTGDNGPKTGDKGAALWFALAGLCGCGLVAMAVAPRYKGKRVA